MLTRSLRGPLRPSRAVDYPAERSPLGGPWKRVFDVAVGGIALVVLTPILLASAGLIRLLLGKPVIVAEERIGYKGRTFNCYAFRATDQNRNCDWVHTRWKLGRTWVDHAWADIVGQALRTSGLEKLPQLFNVLRGDMSLIGPRPIAGSELLRHRSQMPEYFLARPGVTGMWRYVDRRKLYRRKSRLAIDRYYIRYWSMRLDLILLIKAIFSNPSKGER